MKEPTYENFLEELNNRAYLMRECSICSAPLIVFSIKECEFNPLSLPEDTVAMFDSNCGCTRYHSEMTPMNKEDIMFYFEEKHGHFPRLQKFINGEKQY